ncbi:polyprenyl synthetase family protein [Oceanidesulfovibrio marinus]|uniref:Polyprenyl synthetase family protein n=1 Tax=Oceanidesulfovibrio marinus TaxID=370038 RepID=A0A6P1ZGX3_9BACT|nr:polyprenyl synthetase family protein [Oceanidesulfovibrio marinus]TVM32796.1 polyprenyl synthetase family protein [Oceanidesulfovibrio marinus]
MHALIAYMGNELPTINEHLDSCVRRLDPFVQPIARHVLNAGGKRLRPLLTLISFRAFGGQGDPYPMASSLELLHSATLLHDDILDRADLRRGRPSAHLVYGRHAAILGGDALLALGNKIVAEYGDARLTNAISEAIMATATGEIREIAQVGNMSLTNAEYLEIVTGKTAYLIEAATRCGALLAGADNAGVEQAAQFGLNLGIAFQLVDDVLDYASSEEEAGKTVAADLREGKATLPLILYLESAAPEERKELQELVRRIGITDMGNTGAGTQSDDVQNNKGRAMSQQDLDLVIAAVQRVRETGAVERGREIAAGYAEAARASLQGLPPSPETELLGEALEYVVRRNK